jgi:subtilisin family serine protease
VVQHVKRLHPALTAILAVGAWLSAGARAQTVVPELDPSERTSLGYRDGADWVSVERLADGRVALREHGYTFHAVVGREVLVQPAASADLAALGVRVLSRLSQVADLYLVESLNVDEDGVALAQRLSYEPRLEFAVPDLQLARRRYDTIDGKPNDPRYDGQWYLKKANVQAAYKISSGDAHTIVVVIDDGCDVEHPDLKRAFAGGPGYDAVDDDDDPSYMPNIRSNAHGTECSGLIGAEANNGIGIVGVCPSCSMRCVRLLRADDKGVALSADVRAFDYAFEQKAAVISNSWGFAEPMPVAAPLRTVIAKVVNEGRDGLGTAVVFAAGNENRAHANHELTGLPGVLTIGATNNFDEAAPFGNYGDTLFISSPTGTLTTDISGQDGDEDGDYTNLFGGTSSACPVAAGVLGLLFSAKPDLSAADARTVLIETAREAPYATPDDEGHDRMYGYGVIDAAAALRSVLGLPEEAPDAGIPDVAAIGEDHPGNDHSLDAGSDAGSPPKPAAKSGGGCALAGASTSRVPYDVGVWLTLAWVLARSQRRRRIRGTSSAARS